MLRRLVHISQVPHRQRGGGRAGGDRALPGRCRDRVADVPCGGCAGPGERLAYPTPFFIVLLPFLFTTTLLLLWPPAIKLLNLPYLRATRWFAEWYVGGDLGVAFPWFLVLCTGGFGMLTLTARQYEVITGPLGPLEAADAVVFTRETIYNIAHKHGFRATLAPRIYANNCEWPQQVCNATP